MGEFIVGSIAIVAIFIGMPWLILHYVTKWKSTGTVSREDENLLEELYETARRLDDRLHSIERIMVAENPELEVRRPSPELPRAEIRQIREK